MKKMKTLIGIIDKKTDVIVIQGKKSFQKLRPSWMRKLRVDNDLLPI